VLFRDIVARFDAELSAEAYQAGLELLRAGRTSDAAERFEAAIRMVRAAGGVAVLAHAAARSRGPVIDLSVIAGLAAEGLAGVEVDHPDHAAGDRAALRDLAAELGLLVTGSSDYHGTNKTVSLGQETTDPEALERIEELAASSRVAAVTG